MLTSVNNLNETPPPHFPFDVVPDEIIESFMYFMPDKDLSTFAQTDNKILGLARKVKRFRTEALLVHIFKTYTDGYWGKVKKAGDLLGSVTEAKKLFNACGKLPGGTDEKNAALRKAFLPLCGKGSHVQLKTQFLGAYSAFYKEERLVRDLFNYMDQNSLRLTTLVYPCKIDLAANTDGKSKVWKECKYTFAYLDALKERLISQQELTLEIKRPIDEKILAAFAAALHNNAALRTLKLDIYDFTGLERLKDMLQVVNDNPYIKTVELSPKFWFGCPLTKTFDKWEGIVMGADVFNTKRDDFEVLLKDNLEDVIEIKLDGDYLKPELTCSLNKIGTYIDDVLIRLEFDISFSYERKKVFEDLVKEAKESASGRERNAILKHAIVELFTGMNGNELTRPDSEVAEIFKPLRGYDESLYLKILKVNGLA